jgi:ANTAR domain/PAS fold
MSNAPGRAYVSGVGAAAMVAGTFVLDGKTRAMAWSDELYLIHGYRRGDVVPTLALTLAHKHPGDLPRIQAVNRELFTHGGHVAIYHRVIDAQSREHRVLTAGEAVLDQAGNLESVSGVMLDLTSTIQWETELAARDAVRGAMSTTGTIAKAEGILMGRLGIGSDEAFKILAGFSNNRNVKLAGVAQALVSLADSRAEADALGTLIHELQHACSGPGRRMHS